MDTTLTYLFSQNYDTLTILKGPQDVRYGALIAGGLLFDRESVRLESNTLKILMPRHLWVANMDH